MTLPITIGILAKNEQDDLPGCLAQCQFAREVIVLVDRSSTDRTLEIAREANAKIIIAELESFADAHNQIQEAATEEWVLSLDADERLTPELLSSIKGFIGSSEKYAGAYVLRQDVFLGRRLRHGDASDWFLRLGKKAAGKWHRPVHEVWETNEPVTKLAGILEHYSHKNSADYLQKMEFYTDLDASRSQERAAWWQMIIYPIAKFIKVYFVQLGILDGWPGLVFACLNTRYSYTKRRKLYYRQHA